jgi:H+/gluconate symporter-like permease
MVAALGSTESFLTSMFSTFTGGVGSLATMMIALFSISGLLSYMMDQTGCSVSVGRTFVRWLGTDKCYLAISFTSVLLALAGVTGIYVVALVALPLMKEANLPRRIGMLAAQGVAPAINFCLPVANVPGTIPNQFLGTSVYSAPLLSIATGVVGLILFFVYITYAVKKARENGEGFTDLEGKEVKAYDEKDLGELPSFVTSVLPLLAVVVISIVLSACTSMESAAVVVTAQLCACILIAIFHFDRCRKVTFTKLLSEGVTSMWGFLVLACCVYGFGQVVATCAAFQPIQDAVLSLNVNPYVTVVVSVAVVAFLCSDGIAAMMVWLPLFGQTYLDMGVNAGALRRLLLCTTQTFDSMPHAQSTAITLGLFGLTHKEGYKDLFITTVVFPVIFTIFCCICCIIFYPV